MYKYLNSPAFYLYIAAFSVIPRFCRSRTADDHGIRFQFRRR